MVRESWTYPGRALFSRRLLQRFVKELKWSREQRSSALVIRAEACGTTIENRGVAS